MLSGLDVFIGLKILASKVPYFQKPLAKILKVSSSSVNSAIKTLLASRLLIPKDDQPIASLTAWAEFLIVGLKYTLPTKLETITVGMPTAYGAPFITQDIPLGNTICPVWEYEGGSTQGVSLKPLHPSVPDSLTESPDDLFYQILALIDILRLNTSRARDKELAKKSLIEILKKIAVERHQEQVLTDAFLKKLA